jgi:hypothetical protein
MEREGRHFEARRTAVGRVGLERLVGPHCVVEQLHCSGDAELSVAPQAVDALLSRGDDFVLPPWLRCEPLTLPPRLVAEAARRSRRHLDFATNGTLPRADPTSASSAAGWVLDACTAARAAEPRRASMRAHPAIARRAACRRCAREVMAKDEPTLPLGTFARRDQTGLDALVRGRRRRSWHGAVRACAAVIAGCDNAGGACHD